MASHARVENQTNGRTVKRSQARRWVEQRVCDWVEFGVSIRDLSMLEQIERRAAQIKTIDPLPFAELPGCVYRPTEAGRAGARKERALALAANEFFRLTVEI